MVAVGCPDGFCIGHIVLWDPQGGLLHREPIMASLTGTLVCCSGSTTPSVQPSTSRSVGWALPKELFPSLYPYPCLYLHVLAHM